MNFLSEILAFENWKRFNSSINKSDICLWLTLISMANRFNWEEFNAPILTLLSESRLTKNELYKSRNKLKQMGIIDFKERGGNRSTIYKVNSIASLYGKQNVTQRVTQKVKQEVPQEVPQMMNIHKTKNQKPETKNKKKDLSLATLEIDGKNRDAISEREKPKTPKKHKYGEYKNVLLTDEEYEKLIDLCGDDLQGVIEHLSDYIEMKGYKARSHYLAIRKWVILAYKEQLVRYERAMNLARAGGAIYGGNSGNSPKKLCTEYPE